GSSYIIEGAHATGARALKINTLGTLLATFPGDTNMNEMWRVVFDPCSGRMVIGAGGTNSDYQACTLDTNMTKLKVVNVLGASSPGHSMVFTAIDPTGASCYMAAAKSAVLDTAKFNNVLVKMPLPTLTPTVYNVSDGYKLVELASVNYVGPGPGSANGMNGMAVSPNWLYMSDGSTLRKADKNTGAIVNSISISGTSFAWGGLDADICDNVYAGEQSSINVYSSSLSLLSTIALPGIVYDVVLGPNQKTVYACGRAYVSSFDVASSLTLNKIVTPAKCGCNGSAKVTLMACGSLDTTKIAYSWSNGQTTQTANNLCAGIYTVTVLSGCSPIYIDTVAIPSHFVLLNIPSPSICTGGKGVSLTASGAKTYVWKPGTGLSATNTATVKANPATTTTYTVTGTTGGGCKDSDVVVVTVNTTPTVTVSGPLTPVCPNTPVNLTASGASGYTWTPAASVSCATCGKTTASIANITTFTVVGDSLGCTDTAKITVKVYPVPTITINTTPTACDSFTGTATATVSGSGPYTYSWSPAGGTATNAKGLSAGSYVISVTDTNGCITTKTCIINVTPSPTVTATAGVATCDSTNGKTTVTIVGGTGPYTYLWSPGGGTKSTDINLGAGIYSVTVTDVNGCKGSSFTILEDTGATIKFSARNNISCFGGSDGGATVTLVGGTLPYAYAWSPVGETTASVNNLSVGQYTVIVTDKNHCTLIDTLNIHQPSQITASITAANVSNVSCFGGSNGKISVVPGGGTAPYTYLWNDGQTGDTATGLMANSYTATVTDKNGCSVTAFDSVKQPPVLVASASNTSATCGKNGSASVVTIGGTPGYVFNWSGGSGNGSTIYGLGKGTYTCTVTDANGCTDTASTTVDTIGQTAKIKSSKNVTCNGGSNGDATVSVIGGDTSLYGYFWSPTGGVNATAAGLPAGIYTITVTYIADGCTVIVNDTITQPSPVTSSVKYALVCGNKVMAVDSTGGGKPPYTYNWSPSGSTTATANLSSGSYTLTVTDSNGCKTTFSLVAPTTDPVANFVPVPDTVSPGDSIKFVNLSLGGSKWYWTFGDGNSSIDSLPYNIYNYGGSYTVYLKVTNALGCSDSIAENIFVKEGIITPNVFTPNGDGINDGFHVNAYGMKDYKIDIYDRWGLLIFQGTGSDNDWTGRTMAGEMVSVGTYYYIITASDAKGKSFNVKGYLELIR
ncbi:MAG TPA: gliding motility-associated C-terminal domain-containing protein, partial [Bacteroidia bacterium]|nr:gliding motility-associated C-terminal domain-containing protein [Bacteroidia bacterium]